MCAPTQADVDTHAIMVIQIVTYSFDDGFDRFVDFVLHFGLMSLGARGLNGIRSKSSPGNCVMRYRESVQSTHVA